MRTARWLRAALLVLGFLPAPRPARAGYLTLDQAVRLAKKRAPSAVDASFAVATARASGAGAKVPIFRNPSLEITGETSRATKDVNLVSFVYLPVEVSGQRSARVAEWRRLVEWQASRESSAHADTTGAAVSAYGAVLVARARLEQAKRAAAEAEAEAEAYRARSKVGDVTIYDVSAVESESARYRQLEVTAIASLALAVAHFSELVGEAPPDQLGPDEGPPRIAESIRVEDWVDRGPAVRALRSEGRYWIASRERFEADRTPPLVLIATGGRGDYGEARVGGGIGFEFPVFRGNQGEIARADAEQARAGRLAEAVRAALLERARGALAAYRGIVAGVDELDRNGIPAAERAERAVTLALRAGKVEMIRVLIARRDLAAARARRLDLVEVAWSAYAELASIRGALP
ncbi:MAG TPA: TolC family protein [Polyangiaceae bacterium]|nr:TolC family protein [Polyangiaceae bacterium]